MAQDEARNKNLIMGGIFGIKSELLIFQKRKTMALNSGSRRIQLNPLILQKKETCN